MVSSWLVLASFLSYVTAQTLPDSKIFKLNGIFPISRGRYGQVNYQSGVMMAEAMKFAVEKINNESDFLFGYKLQTNEIMDMRTDTRLTQNILQTFTSDIPFLIGPYSSETSYITSILTGTFRQVVISYGATYSGFDKTGPSRGYMVRTVPSDIFRLRVVRTVVEKLQWNYVAVIGSYGYDGERDARHFVSEMPAAGVCLAETIFLPKYPKSLHYKEAIEKLNRDARVKAVILFTTIPDSAKIFSAINETGLNGRFYLLCVYGCANYKEAVEGREESAKGVLSIDLHAPLNGEFREYFLKQTPLVNNAKYFRKFWQNVFNCTFYDWSPTQQKKCYGNEKLSEGVGYYSNTPVDTVINSVYSIAYTLRKFIALYCQMYTTNSTNECQIDASDRKRYSHPAFIMLVNMSYIDGTLDTSETQSQSKIVRYDIHRFDRVNGTFKNSLVGSWEVTRPHLDMYAEDVLQTQTPRFWYTDTSTSQAVCSQECAFNFYRSRDTNPNKARCCWSCAECPFNSVSTNYTCSACKDTEMVKGTTCVSLPQRSIQVTGNVVPIVLLLLVACGLVLVSMVTLLFLRNNSHVVVRSSGRDLCYMILLGIGLAFVTPLSYLFKPTIVSCVLRKTLPGLSFLVCYAPLFLKTNRIFRIFTHAQTSVSRPTLVSPQSQLFLFFAIVLVQLLLGSVSFATELPEPHHLVSTDRLYITLHCKGDSNPIVMVLNLALSVMFMTCCTILAFKTRHFPKNYNEAKYIGITLYITCVVWAVFLPMFFLTQNRGYFIREYLVCSICVVIGYITLVGLFGQKVKLLLSAKPQDELKSAGMLSYSLTKNSIDGKALCQQNVKYNGSSTGSETQRDHI